MKRILLIFLTTFLLTGCGFIKIEREESAVAPVNNKPPIEGKWIITKCIFPEKNTTDNFNYKNLIGKEAIFSPKGVIIGNLYSNEPKFSIKKVNTERYLRDKYNFDKTKVGVSRDSVYVIDIYNNEDFFYEVIKEKEDLAYIIMNGVMVQINRFSEKVTEKEIQNLLTTTNSNNPESVEVYNYSENGFLLGFKQGYLDSSTNLVNWDYKTIYIKLEEDRVLNFYEINKLIFPRQNIFSQINIDRVQENNSYNDIITIKNLENKNKDDLEESNIKIGNEGESSLKTVNFISSDYINIESIYNKNEKSALSFNLMESGKLSSKVSLEDLIKNGERIFEDAAKLNIPIEEEAEFDDSEIGLRRDKGYWRFYGRLNLKRQEDQIYKDFDLNVLIPREVVKYDELSLPMSEIKKTFPYARDVFTSPNNRFLIVMEKEYLRIYNIDKGEISQEASYEYKIGEKAQVILTEWAIGSYADSWERVILNTLN